MIMGTLRMNREGHKTFFFWPRGPIMPRENELEKLVQRCSFYGKIAGANFSEFGEGILEIHFNPCSISEKDRTLVENKITASLEESLNPLPDRPQ